MKRRRLQQSIRSLSTKTIKKPKSRTHDEFDRERLVDHLNKIVHPRSLLNNFVH